MEMIVVLWSIHTKYRPKWSNWKELEQCKRNKRNSREVVRFAYTVTSIENITVWLKVFCLPMLLTLLLVSLFAFYCHTHTHAETCASERHCCHIKAICSHRHFSATILKCFITSFLYRFSAAYLRSIFVNLIILHFHVNYIHIYAQHTHICVCVLYANDNGSSVANNLAYVFIFAMCLTICTFIWHTCVRQRCINRNGDVVAYVPCLISLYACECGDDSSHADDDNDYDDCQHCIM